MIEPVEVHDGTTYDAPAQAPRLSPPRARVAVLEGQAPEVVELSPGQTLSLGRSRSSGLVIDDRAASRLHATLRWEGGNAVTLVDHGSRNGTFVHGRRVEGEVALISGEEVRIGAVRLVVSVPPTAGEGPRPGPLEDDDLVAHDPVMIAVVALADRAAPSEATVLLEGETGVGKDVLARRIHVRSGRPGPFVGVNCGAIPETLAESTLFGHEKGAFTGASGRQAGVFESAHRGTLFLDEVGELSAAMQSRLLRVLEAREVVRVGSTEPVPIDVRLLSATNRDLSELVRAGAFRQDLLYRIDVLRITVPPLRKRPDDIVPIAHRFVDELAPGGGVRLSRGAEQALGAHSWPGNVRELRNVLERAVAVADSPVLGVKDLFGEGRRDRGGALRSQMGDLEREAIVEALEQCGGNQSRAARRLGISRRALIYKMERLGLKDRPPSRRG